jgi:hypothetical protein
MSRWKGRSARGAEGAGAHELAEALFEGLILVERVADERKPALPGERWHQASASRRKSSCPFQGVNWPDHLGQRLAVGDRQHPAEESAGCRR